MNLENIIKKNMEDNIYINRNFINNNISNIIKISIIIMDRFFSGNKIMFFGNGGSASDSQHITAEFVNKFKNDRVPLPAISLSSDISVITSIANDFSFDDIFKKQIQALGKYNDIVFGITTSGKSKNIIEAFKFAYENKLTTILLSGKIEDDEILNFTNYSLQVPSNTTERIQECHILVLHTIIELIENLIVDKN